jgi:hypothetical protein
VIGFLSGKKRNIFIHRAKIVVNATEEISSALLAILEKGTVMSKNPSFPWWLKPANRMVILLNRLGLSLGTMHILSIPGRKTGKMRSTPVSVLRVNGQRYILTGLETGWVKNARAAGWGLLSYGRKKERVTLIELPIEERSPILREFPLQVPGGVQFFERLLDLPNDPEAFAQAVPRCPVFRLDSSDARDADIP